MADLGPHQPIDPTAPVRSRHRSRRSAAAAESDALLRRYASTRSPADLDRLVRRFRPLARKLALRYARGSEPVDDLEQIACLGLVKALHGFDPSRGFAFTSFAAPTILGELRRSFRSTGWAVHVPRALQERVAEVRIDIEEFSSRRGRSPTVAELAARSRFGLEEVVEALQATDAVSALSTDARFDSEDESGGEALIDRLGGPDAGYEAVEDRAALRSALPALTSMERRVLDLRFGSEMKQKEIAIQLGVSQMQVSRVLRAALERLSFVARHQTYARTA